MSDGVSPGDPGLRIACRDLVELLTDYLEGALAPPAAIEVGAHLAICPPCQVYFDQVRETVTRLGRVDAVENLCDDARAEVLTAFREILRPR